MTEQTPGFVEQIKSFPRPFWIANTMEIFERMSWYGFFALSSLYITGPVETGALGFTSEQRGAIQAMIPFLLYLMPVVTGAIADRYGFKKMFLISYVGMIVFYYLLGQFTSMPTFMLAFFGLAVAAAIFKPVVVGTIARVTTDENSRLGFGVFYMMVNVGGFFGPIVAGILRGIAWEYLFLASAGWAAVNLVLCLLFYKEPPKPADFKARKLSEVGQTIYEVLGNLRLFLTIMVVVFAMMVAQFGPWWFKWNPHAAIFIPGWIVANFLWDAMLPADSGRPPPPGKQAPRPLFQRMHCSDWRFALFLLILSGFWTSFNQIFLTMPEYIRDFSETRTLVQASRSILGDEWGRKLASVEENEFYAEVDDLLRRASGAKALVEEDEKEKSPREVAKENRKSLGKLIKKASKLADSRHLPVGRASEVEGMVATLEAVNEDDTDAVASAIKKYEKEIKPIQREEKLAAYKTYPGITEELLNRLDHIAGQLNARRVTETEEAEDADENKDAASDPIEALDLLESSRKVLAYKVRFAPVEYAEMVAGIPLDRRAPSEKAIEDAREAFNKRLWNVLQPKFEETERHRAEEVLRDLLNQHGVLISAHALRDAAETLSSDHRTVNPKVLAVGWRRAAYYDSLYEPMDNARQFNPEFIININALGIVLFQVIVSVLMSRFHQFTGMIVGMVVAAVGIGLPMFAGDQGVFGLGGAALIVCAGILTFSFGEMMASPTSQEYVGRIAPEDKKALYMGYYFVSVALGNLFGGILSGEIYGKIARDMQRPDIMWMIFGAIMLGTALVFLIYNKVALRKPVPAS